MNCSKLFLQKREDQSELSMARTAVKFPPSELMMNHKRAELNLIISETGYSNNFDSQYKDSKRGECPTARN